MAENRLKELTALFEKEQEEYGTETAVYNLIWLTASDILGSIGVKHIKTSDKPSGKKKTKRKKR